jgi:hypothetical protein
MSWLHSSHVRRPHDANSHGQGWQVDTEAYRAHDWNLQINIPTPVLPFTLAHSQTPGWDVPWTPRVTPSVPKPGSHLTGNTNTGEGDDTDSRADVGGRGNWKKKFRTFVLNNHYAPLVGILLRFESSHSVDILQLFRFINITLTSAALAVAIHIRMLEARFGITGALGSSPYVFQVVLMSIPPLMPSVALSSLFSPL